MCWECNLPPIANDKRFNRLAIFCALDKQVGGDFNIFIGQLVIRRTNETTAKPVIGLVFLTERDLALDANKMPLSKKPRGYPTGLTTAITITAFPGLVHNHFRDNPSVIFPIKARAGFLWNCSAHLGDENSYDPEYVALKINDFRKVAAPLAARFTTANRRSNVFVAANRRTLTFSEDDVKNDTFFQQRTQEAVLEIQAEDKRRTRTVAYSKNYLHNIFLKTRLHTCKILFIAWVFKFTG
ncbi:hypothetical protein TcasGA2_TC007668 [Tribolium castaneum]|uniref:Uncharacterized protein n=1 Tax=Tribolium castaneum TaxID=7070 RepID=D2A2C9_TRICA|nr:hypothetical protein TcasGA2_TC007668 [Tribolium castaneum]